MNSHDRQTPAGRTRLLRVSSTAAAGLMIAGVGGTAAAAAIIAHQQQTADAGTQGTNNGSTPHQLPGLSGSRSHQSSGGSNGS